jgi:hypothetical protein
MLLNFQRRFFLKKITHKKVLQKRETDEEEAVGNYRVRQSS